MSDSAREDARGSVVAFPGGPGGASSPDNNLPFQLTSLVGREKEIAEVGRLLGSTRLLTLTGPGGCGKTRLALAVASDLVKEFEDGVWLVELAPLADPALVPQALASVLEVREQPGRPLIEMLSDYLGARKMLLVLDNCEHLIEACAGLADALLRACPNLRILASSREALDITGEIGWLVPSLSLPDPRRLPAVEGLPRYEATRLFLERAAAVKPGFELTARNAMAVARVCHRLDGMPLAIELAAARVRVLSVEQIAQGLDESFRLLSGGSRTAMAHHRTLRATTDWSHELLSGEEQVLFRRLAVFAGGFTLSAAEAVGVGEGTEQNEVLGLLARLVDKSLILMTEQGGEARYRLLETVRQYGREKLQESGEAERARRRHAEYCLALAERAAPHLKGRRQVEWLERLEREHDNLRAAMAWLLEEGEIETAVRLTWALRFFWYQRGHQGEGYRYIAEALNRDGALSVRLRAKAFHVGAMTSYGLESIERTKQLCEESVALFRQAGDDKSGLAIALGGVGLVALQQGDIEEASASLEESVKLYREAGDDWGVSSILLHLGMIPFGRGDYTRAVRYFEEALALSRKIGDRLISYLSLYNLALASQVRGDHERAARLYVEGLELAVEVGDKANAAYCLEGLAGLISARDEPERAAWLFGTSEALLETVGTPLRVRVPDRTSIVDALRSRLGEMAFAAAWAKGRAMTPEQAVECALQRPLTPEEKPTSPTAYPAGLSAREVEVLRLVAQGMTNAQVAQTLFISPRTVNAHLGSIYNKLGFNSRTEATRFAVEHNLL